VSRLLFEDNRHLAMDNKELLMESMRLNAELLRLGSLMAKPEEEVRLELVLDIDMADVFEEDAEEFKTAVAQDVASAVDGDPDKVRVLSLEAGSIRVLMALDEGVCNSGVRALDVANDLQKQVDDPDSRLKQGRFTKASIAAKVSVVKGMPKTSQSIAPRAYQLSKSGAASPPDEVQLAEMRVAQLQMENETLRMQTQDLEAHSTALQHKVHSLREELEAAVLAEGHASGPKPQAASSNFPDQKQLQRELDQSQVEIQTLAETLDGANQKCEQLGFDLEMTRCVSEERAQQLEESLRAQGDLQDQVDRLSLLSGWQKNDLPGHDAKFAPEIVGLDAADDEGGAHETYRMGHAAESVQMPPEVLVRAEAPGKRGRVKLGAGVALRPLEQFAPSSEQELAGSDDAWKPLSSAEEADAMKELHNERDRCDTLAERVMFLEEELSALNETHEDLLEEHKVLATSFQEVQSKLMGLSEEQGISFDSGPEPAVRNPRLPSLNLQFDDESQTGGTTNLLGRLAVLLEKRDGPQAGALYTPRGGLKVSSHELILLVEECVQNEQVMAQRIIELEEANQHILDEHDRLAVKLHELSQQRQGSLEEEEAEEVRLELVLDMDLADIHPDDEQEFKNVVACDVAAAVGGDSSKVRVLALESGSIRVITALDPGVCGDQDPLNVARNLAQQASDPNSALKNGRFTSTATGATVSIAKVLVQEAAHSVEPSSPRSECSDVTRKLQKTPVELDDVAQNEEQAQVQAVQQPRRGHGPKLGNAAPLPKVPALPTPSQSELDDLRKQLAEANRKADVDRAEQESKQLAFVEEIARLSAVAEERRCQLLDTHAKIAELQDELGVQHKRSQKAAADMYVEMDRMQAQIDGNNAEIKDLLTQLHDSQTYAREWEEESIKEKQELESKAETLEKRWAKSEQDRVALRAKHEAQQAETSDFLAKLDGNAEASRLMDENRQLFLKSPLCSDFIMEIYWGHEF
jgi:hypothetical protein